MIMHKLLYYLVVFQLFVNQNVTKGQVSSSFENIDLQTDRDIYIAGEELFFKCFRFDGIPNAKVGSKYAYLVLRNEKNTLIKGICLKLENNMFSGSIYLPDTLSTGRYQLVSYTNCMRNYGERTFFHKEIIIANRFDQDLSKLVLNNTSYDILSKSNNDQHLIEVSSEKNNFKKREKIKITLLATGIEENEMAQLSVSVREKTIHHNENKTISDSAGAKISPCLYLPEINGIIFEGRVVNPDNQQPVSNTRVFLSTQDTVANLQYVITSNEGKFCFLLNDYFDNKNLVLNLPDIKRGRIELINKFELKEPFELSGCYADSLFKKYLIKSQNIVKIQKIYNIETKQEVANEHVVHGVAPMVYPPVTDPVYPADFVSLPDFVEISREILPLLKTRKRGDSYEARIVNLSNTGFFTKDPLIFLDGVPINSINQIINLGSDKIRKVETVGYERYDGNFFYHGILAVYSHKQEINNIVWETPALSTKYIVFYPMSVLKLAEHKVAAESPDFRQLLYWEPSVILKANEKKTIEFSSSDNTGEFEVFVEGVNSNGKPIRTTTTLKIGIK
jgi:hypothetical protein